MAEMYKGERVADLLKEIDRLENLLREANKDIDPFSQARYEEYCHAFSVLTIAKAKLRAIKGEKA